MNDTIEVESQSAPSSALTKIDDNPAHLMRRATDVAGVSRSIVMKTAMKIQGRQYVRVEGWQAIAVAHGCVASARDVERIDSGFRAIGEVRRMSDGLVLATAEGFVGDDETATWAKRPEYARRAMAQTRAISRACRSAFAHVVVLIDANLSTTPAEEVPYDGFDEAPRPAAAQPAPAPKAAPRATVAQSEPAQQEPGDYATIWESSIVPARFKKHGNKSLGQLKSEDVGYIWWLIKNFKAEPYNGKPPTQADVEFRTALDLAENDLRAATAKGADDARAEIDKNDDVPF